MEIGAVVTKLNWKTRILFGACIAIFYGFVLYFLGPAIFGDSKLFNFKSVVFQGVGMGLFFTIGFPYVSGRSANHFASKLWKAVTPDLLDGEQIKTEGPANLFKGIEAVGGKLFLTNQRLIFKTHNYNIQKGQTNFAYADIAVIKERKTANLIANGIRVKTKNGIAFDFIVNERSVWIAHLDHQLETKKQNIRKSIN